MIEQKIVPGKKVTLTLILGDCMDYLRTHKEEGLTPFHCALDDPPYNLESVQKRFGSGSTEAQGDVYNRSGKGFMNQLWDTDISFNPELWELSGEALYPGGFIGSFGGARTSFRMAYAAWLANLHIKDTIAYVYGTGFPKPHNISKALDMAAGAERGKKRIAYTGNAVYRMDGQNTRPWMEAALAKGYHEVDDDTPVTPLGRLFSGHKGSSPLKPAQEPFYLIQTPYEKVSDQEIRAATGWDYWHSIRHLKDKTARALSKKINMALPDEFKLVSKKSMNPDLDSHKIVYDENDDIVAVFGTKPYKPWTTSSIAASAIVHRGAGSLYTEGVTVPPDKNNKVRQAANLALQHNPDCVPVTFDNKEDGPITGMQCSEGCPVQELGWQGSPNLSRVPTVIPDNTVTVDQYFNQVGWQYEIAEAVLTDPGFKYIKKPSKKEKDAGLHNQPDRTKKRINSGGLANDPRWADVPSKNNHATTKSIDFCSHVATLLLPPRMHDKDGNRIPRRLLVRFAGSGSEVIGAMLARDDQGEGWDEIVAIEIEPDYYNILFHRLSWWLEQIDSGLVDVKQIINQENHVKVEQNDFEWSQPT